MAFEKRFSYTTLGEIELTALKTIAGNQKLTPEEAASYLPVVAQAVLDVNQSVQDVAEIIRQVEETRRTGR